MLKPSDPRTAHLMTVVGSEGDGMAASVRVTPVGSATSCVSGLGSVDTCSVEDALVMEPRELRR